MFSQAIITFGEYNTELNSLEVNYYSEEEIGGCQFNITGATLTGAYGGVAEEANWTISNSETTWLGLSFSGVTLPNGNNNLTNIYFIPYEDEICIEFVVLAGGAGANINTLIGECFLTTAGCMDENASNYNPDATADNGSCEYLGCIYEQAYNFDFYAQTDDGSCIFNFGDLNGDTEVDILDIVLLVNQILEEQEN